MATRSERDQLEASLDAIELIRKHTENIDSKYSRDKQDRLEKLAYAISMLGASGLFAVSPVLSFGVMTLLSFAKMKSRKFEMTTSNVVKRRARILSSKPSSYQITPGEVEEAVILLNKLGRELSKTPDIAKESASYQEFRGSGLGATLSREEGLARLDAIAVDDESTDWIASAVLGVTEVADRFNVVRSTVDNWRRTKRAIALQRGPRNYVYPERQFTRLGPVDGIKGVLSHFSDAEEAWEWLVTENPYTGKQAPIDRLHEGAIEEVIRAAEGALDFT